MTHRETVPQPMVVCGDDALAIRLAGELHDIYRQPVTLLVPDADTIGPEPPPTTRIVEADAPDAAALREAGAAQAEALALVYGRRRAAPLGCRAGPGRACEVRPVQVCVSGRRLTDLDGVDAEEAAEVPVDPVLPYGLPVGGHRRERA
ncbi:hypothetical protein ACIPW5_06805 [Streptomyces sp. NPDC090077]|uniref:hypothetical protein n=1 Tax=Streptomyces sp. NPDC090077 TaxID=3365938 RepID=UPI003821AF37